MQKVGFEEIRRFTVGELSRYERESGGSWRDIESVERSARGIAGAIWLAQLRTDPTARLAPLLELTMTELVELVEIPAADLVEGDDVPPAEPAAEPAETSSASGSPDSLVPSDIRSASTRG